MLLCSPLKWTAEMSTESTERIKKESVEMLVLMSIAEQEKLLLSLWCGKVYMTCQYLEALVLLR